MAKAVFAGYTPLHMAVGYSHISTVRVLLEAGANPEIVDTQGRNVLQLVDSIREQMPLNPQLAGKRVALEEVSALLTGLSLSSGRCFQLQGHSRLSKRLPMCYREVRKGRIRG